MKLAQHTFSLFINRGGISLQTTGGWRGKKKMGVKNNNPSLQQELFLTSN